jgi:8-oxo-dGTP diphosphatase
MASWADINRVRVAAGILQDAEGRVLITERLCDGSFNGLWEFPGGKIGPGESATQALARELAEELGIELQVTRQFMNVCHDYADLSVSIDFFLVTDWRNDPAGIEGQRLRWVDASLLDAKELLPADLPVVEALRDL